MHRQQCIDKVMSSDVMGKRHAWSLSFEGSILQTHLEYTPLVGGTVCDIRLSSSMMFNVHGMILA